MQSCANPALVRCLSLEWGAPQQRRCPPSTIHFCHSQPLQRIAEPVEQQKCQAGCCHHTATGPLRTNPQPPYTPKAIPSPPPVPAPLSPFRRLLPFGIDEFFDVPLERRSHRRRPSEFFVQMIPAFGATGDMLLDSEHFSLEEFLQGVALHHND